MFYKELVEAETGQAENGTDELEELLWYGFDECCCVFEEEDEE